MISKGTEVNTWVSNILSSFSRDFSTEQINFEQNIKICRKQAVAKTLEATKISNFKQSHMFYNSDVN